LSSKTDCSANGGKFKFKWLTKKTLLLIVASGQKESRPARSQLCLCGKSLLVPYWQKQEHIMKNVIENRLLQIRKSIFESGLDTFMVLIEENRRYLSGFTGEDSQFD